MKLLIVDDNAEFSSVISEIVESYGHKTQVINNPNSAIEYFFKYHTQISSVFLDIEFGPNEEFDGLDLLDKFRKYNPQVPIIMISGKGTIESAVRATKLGAVNFIEKSLVTKEKIKELLETVKLYNKTENTDDLVKFINSHGIIGKSQAIVEVADQIVRYGRTDLNVLITGETGTGKKLVAKAIHSISRRNKFPFITVDIPNITRELFQSELFGHIKGAFSGATDTKKGLFHEANKGTLFLDEIGELSLDLQSNLFIPIEEKAVRKVGSVQSEEIDIRFISATDKNLIDCMKEGKFREQLYHRLRECEIELPPLFKRKDDIPEIVAHYLMKHNQDFTDNKVIQPAALDYIAELQWPGNVRELSSMIKLVCQTTTKDQIEVTDIMKNITARPNNIFAVEIDMTNSTETLKEDLQKHDKKKIEETLKKCNGNVSKSAALLGVSRETLHNKIRKYEIDAQIFRVKK